MMMGGVNPAGGLRPLIVFGPSGTTAPAAVAPREPAATSKTGEAAIRGESWSGDWGQGVGAQFPKRVVAAPAQLATD